MIAESETLMRNQQLVVHVRCMFTITLLVETVLLVTDIINNYMTVQIYAYFETMFYVACHIFRLCAYYAKIKLQIPKIIPE